MIALIALYMNLYVPAHMLKSIKYLKERHCLVHL